MTAGGASLTLPSQAADEASEGVEQFIERMGLNAQIDGMPRIAGRLFGYFIIYGGPVSFAQLAEALKVSRGSVSTNARMLESFGFIEKVTMPGDRQDYYRLSPSPYVRMIDGVLARMRRMQTIVDQADSSIPDSMQETRQRLREMKRFYREAGISNELLLKKLSLAE
jgi:DNA-binding transcriptional regulator GbsR (MarR family)